MKIYLWKKQAKSANEWKRVTEWDKTHKQLYRQQKKEKGGKIQKQTSTDI
jgi:hypothetical protein